jgi:hypothetical protein
VALGCNQHASVAISMCLHSQRPPKAAVAEHAALAAALADSESASSPRPALTAPIQDAYTARPDRCVEWAPCTEAKSVPPSRDCTEKYSPNKRKGPRKGPSECPCIRHVNRRDGRQQGLGLLCQVRQHHLC